MLKHMNFIPGDLVLLKGEGVICAANDQVSLMRNPIEFGFSDCGVSELALVLESETACKCSVDGNDCGFKMIRILTTLKTNTQTVIGFIDIDKVSKVQ